MSINIRCSSCGNVLNVSEYARTSTRCVNCTGKLMTVEYTDTKLERTCLICNAVDEIPTNTEIEAFHICANRAKSYQFSFRPLGSFLTKEEDATVSSFSKKRLLVALDDLSLVNTLSLQTNKYEISFCLSSDKVDHNKFDFGLIFLTDLSLNNIENLETLFSHSSYVVVVSDAVTTKRTKAHDFLEKASLIIAKSELIKTEVKVRFSKVPVHVGVEANFYSLIDVAFEKKAGTSVFFVFTGQWGYEILNSQGWLRKLKRLHPETIIGVASRGNVKFLYERACDIYIDFTDLLGKYEAVSNGTDCISKEDKKYIEDVIKQTVVTKDVRIVWSFNKYIQQGICYGIQQRSQYHWIRNVDILAQQDWMRLTLLGFEKEKQIFNKAFPELLHSEYIVVQDRFSKKGWGPNSFSETLWLKIIENLKRLGCKIVLIGYTPYKTDDSYSVFHNRAFKEIPDVTNLSDFLTKHRKDNLLYQAIVIEQAKFHLGILGSINLLPLLLGVDAYGLVAERCDVNAWENDLKNWNPIFEKLGSKLYYIDTKLNDEESVLDTLEKRGFFSPLRPQKPKEYDNRNLSFLPSLANKEATQYRIPVVTFCMNRFFYTKYCWTRLYTTTQVKFDHYVIDNGSLDETREWLDINRKSFKHIIYNKENKGLKESLLQVLPLVQDSPFIILGSNDLEPITPNILGEMYQFWEYTVGKRFLFSPIIHGIRSKIEMGGHKKIGRWNTVEVQRTGSCFQLMPVDVLTRYLSKAKEWRANDFCELCKKEGISNLYLTDLHINHFETSEGQVKRYPTYPVRNCKEWKYIR